MLAKVVSLKDNNQANNYVLNCAWTLIRKKVFKNCNKKRGSPFLFSCHSTCGLVNRQMGKKLK